MRYIDILPDLDYSYNQSKYRSIKTQPSLVNNENENKIWHVLHDNLFDNIYSLLSTCISLRSAIKSEFRVSKIKRKLKNV